MNLTEHVMHNLRHKSLRIIASLTPLRELTLSNTAAISPSGAYPPGHAFKDHVARCSMSARVPARVVPVLSALLPDRTDLTRSFCILPVPGSWIPHSLARPTVSFPVHHHLLLQPVSDCLSQVGRDQVFCPFRGSRIPCLCPPPAIQCIIIYLPLPPVSGRLSQVGSDRAFCPVHHHLPTAAARVRAPLSSR